MVLEFEHCLPGFRNPSLFCTNCQDRQGSVGHAFCVPPGLCNVIWSKLPLCAKIVQKDQKETVHKLHKSA